MSVSRGLAEAVAQWCYSWLGGATEVRLGPSDGTVGDSAYVTVQVITDEWVATPDSRPQYPDSPTGVIHWSLRGSRYATVEVQGYGPGSTDIVRDLATAWGEPWGPGATLREGDDTTDPARPPVTPLVAQVVQRIPQPRDGQWIERARVVLPAYYVGETEPRQVDAAASVVLQIDTERDGDTIVSESRTYDLPE